VPCAHISPAAETSANPGACHSERSEEPLYFAHGCTEFHCEEQHEKPALATIRNRNSQSQYAAQKEGRCHTNRLAATIHLLI